MVLIPRGPMGTVWRDIDGAISWYRSIFWYRLDVLGLFSLADVRWHDLTGAPARKSETQMLEEGEEGERECE